MRVQDTQVCKAAANNAAADPQLAGIDPLTILTAVSGIYTMLMGLFAKCQTTPPTPASTQEHLQAAFHDESNEYDRSVLGPAVIECKKQLRKDQQVHHLGKDGRAQATAMAVHSLDAIRTASSDAVGECFAACQFETPGG